MVLENEKSFDFFLLLKKYDFVYKRKVEKTEN